jgi:hypothetical protein
MITPAHLRGLLFLSSGFHAIWTMAVYLVPGSIARWLSMGQNSSIPFSSTYFFLVLVISMIGLSGALYPQRLRLILWILPVLKGIEMYFSYLFIAEAAHNSRILFHLTGNGLIWLVLYFYVILSIPKGKN